MGTGTELRNAGSASRSEAFGFSAGQGGQAVAVAEQDDARSSEVQHLQKLAGHCLGAEDTGHELPHRSPAEARRFQLSLVLGRV